jgi:rod shape-determining protein MreC
MRKTTYWPYVLLALFLFCLMSFPQRASEKVRSLAVCSVSPCWHALYFLKEKTLNLLMIPVNGMTQNSKGIQNEFDKLQQENVMLRAQIENVRAWLLFEDRIQQQLEFFKTVASQPIHDPDSKEFFLRRSREMSSALASQIQSVPATVIFREPSSWSSSVWLNVGEKDNIALGKQVITKNSPVVSGTSVIGVIEHVGANTSRVRLITDSRLTPSVRAVRGKEQNRYLLEHLNSILFALEARADLIASLEEKQHIANAFHRFKEILNQQTEERYLAKGELSGNSSPLFRTRSQILRGVGFNYDFTDDESAAHDLRFAKIHSSMKKREAKTILQKGDLLITTGLDGVFPPGLRVAIVSKVECLKEGASSYEIEAISTAGNLDDLSHVFVLPSL